MLLVALFGTFVCSRIERIARVIMPFDQARAGLKSAFFCRLHWAYLYTEPWLNRIRTYAWPCRRRKSTDVKSAQNTVTTDHWPPPPKFCYILIVEEGIIEKIFGEEFKNSDFLNWFFIIHTKKPACSKLTQNATVPGQNAPYHYYFVIYLRHLKSKLNNLSLSMLLKI